MMRPAWIILAALLAALVMHYWLGIGANDLLWDACNPPPPQPERPWPTHKPCPEVPR